MKKDEFPAISNVIWSFFRNCKADFVPRFREVLASISVLICLSLSVYSKEAEKKISEELKIDKVFFAQHHVLTPEDKYFKLVGNLETLIKVQVYSDTGRISPLVSANLSLKSKTLEIPLTGPATLPKPSKADPLLIEHKFEDAFTAYIPKEWIQPGLEVTVELREKLAADNNGGVLHSKTYDRLLIGAPTRLILSMFDIHFFGGGENKDYPEGWFEELGSKLPVAELELRRTKGIFLDKLVMYPRNGRPAILCGSKQEWAQKAGQKFDGEQRQAKYFNVALKEAAGSVRRLQYANIYGVNAGGEAGGLSGVGNGGNLGILLHELGHAFGLPHWKDSKKYPYVGPMLGINAGANSPHGGPNWGFDLNRRSFIPSTYNGRFKHDPMQGGGGNAGGTPHYMGQFSDYSLNRIRETLEYSQRFWDERAACYKMWNQDEGAYTKIGPKKGDPGVPVEINVEVVTVMTSISSVTPEGCYVYAPIGPYDSNCIEPVKESTPFSLRISQGGKEKSYFINAKIKLEGDPQDPGTYAVWAINVPARDGEVTKAELLQTKDGKVLATWNKTTSPANRTSFVTALYPRTAAASQVAQSGNNTNSTKVTTTTSVAQEKPKLKEASMSKATLKSEVSSPAGSVVSIKSAKRSNVSEATLAEWTGKLKQRIASASKSGKPFKGYLNVLGKTGNYPLVGCNEKELQVDFNGNTMPIPWSWMKQQDLFALVKSLKKEDDVESLLLLTVFLFANGEIDAGEDILARATLLDSTAATKLREQLK